ncbi:MAG: hypothetical protein LAT65_00025 [Saccharospirillum sp.]|nr:hypothetical protein [Saccharospirillum sp.]
MDFLNIGKKDKLGKQRRIEHRGKHLRASRTGGVSFRAQTRAAGLNLTANSRHGVRVSRSVGKNTQMALQNGRFVLRGRYGSGPTRLNLSKTGMTVSSRNKLGTFNWVKPKRSSAKLFGVQVRGKNAVYAHLVFALFNLVFSLVQVTLLLLWNLARWLILLLGLVAHWALKVLQKIVDCVMAAPDRLAQFRYGQRSRRLRKSLALVAAADRAAMEALTQPQLVAAMVLLFTARGRGQTVQENMPRLIKTLSKAQDAEPLRSSAADVREASDTLKQLLPDPDDHNDPLRILVIVAGLAEQAGNIIPAESLPELVFSLDELMLQQGRKTRLQEAMIDVFSDFAGLTLVAEPHTVQGAW